MTTSKSNFHEDARSRFLAYALYDSIQDMDLRSIQYLLVEKKANPNHFFKDMGISPLHIAAGIGDEWFSIRVLRTCMMCGGNPNVRSSDGLTPVHIAAIWKRMEVLKLLIEFGGDISIADEDGFTPLDYIKKADDLTNMGTFEDQGSAQIDNEGEQSSMTSVVTPLCVTSRNTTKFEDVSCEFLTEDEGIDTLNNAFIEDDKCLHLCSIQTNNPILSDIPSDLCYSEVDSSRISCKLQSLFSDQQYQPLKSVDRDILISYPTYPHYDSITLQTVDKQKEIQLSESPRMAQVQRSSHDRSIYYEAQDFLTESSCGSLSSCPTEKLRHLLQENEILHGPLVKSTKRVYLYQLRKASNGLKERSPNPQPLDFNDVIISTFGGKIIECVDKWSPLESLMIEQFETHDKHGLKLDSSRQYFTYLLLNPIITREIEKSNSRGSLNRSWPSFLKSVFYIGKGKNSRPMDHLIDAVNSNKSLISDKIRKIKTIWEEGFGVVCIHIFHNITEAEALTREACMISALSVAKLTNIQSGKCYGGIEKWSLKKRRQLGVVLLFRAMLLMIAEGERQIYAADLRKMKK